MTAWIPWLALPAGAWLVHRGLRSLSRLVEPRCPRCGGRSWTQGPRGELACASCPSVREQLEMELAA
jgi:tRNA(Ile2) C34 agmatinyltransferase TiaS